MRVVTNLSIQRFFFQYFSFLVRLIYLYETVLFFVFVFFFVEQQQLEKTDYIVEERKKLKLAFEQSKVAKRAQEQQQLLDGGGSDDEHEEIERPIEQIGSRECTPTSTPTTTTQQQHQQQVPPVRSDVSDEFLKEQIRLQTALLERERELKRVALELVIN